MTPAGTRASPGASPTLCAGDAGEQSRPQLEMHRGGVIDYLRRARFFSSRLDVVAIESWGGVDRSG